MKKRKKEEEGKEIAAKKFVGGFGRLAWRSVPDRNALDAALRVCIQYTSVCHTYQVPREKYYLSEEYSLHDQPSGRGHRFWPCTQPDLVSGYCLPQIIDQDCATRMDHCLCGNNAVL